jgi:hypothetical protein
MKVRYVLAAVAALAVAVPAVAADQEKTDQSATKDKKICHTETVTGSLIAKRRICKTQAEWDEISANTKKQMDDYTRRMGNRDGAGQAGG